MNRIFKYKDKDLKHMFRLMKLDLTRKMRSTRLENKIKGCGNKSWICFLFTCPLFMYSCLFDPQTIYFPVFHPYSISLQYSMCL